MMKNKKKRTKRNWKDVTKLRKSYMRYEANARRVALDGLDFIEHIECKRNTPFMLEESEYEEELALLCEV